jgi:adenylate kinase family enzyme
MAQAEHITTAIRELMSRGQPLKSTNRVRAAHTEFVAALAGNAQHPIRSDANWEPLKGRADHLEKTIAALHVYLSAIIAETAEDIPASTLDRRYLDGLFQQFSADVLGAIRDAAAEMRVRENWRAS